MRALMEPAVVIFNVAFLVELTWQALPDVFVLQYSDLLHIEIAVCVLNLLQIKERW